MFSPLSLKEEFQLKLSIIHDHTEREEIDYLATIQANVKMRWPATETYILGLKQSRELAYQESKNENPS